MPVAVVGSDADEPDGGVEPPIQLGILVGAAVVRHLHDLHARHIDQALQLRLRLSSEVAQKHRPRKTSTGDVEGDAGVVTRFGARERTERLPACRADGSCHPDLRRDEACSPVREIVEQSLVRGLRDRTVQHGVRPTDDGRRSADVVQIEVRQYDEVESVHTEARQAGAKRLGIGSGVDERDRALRSPERRVALAHVAHRHLPVRGHGQGARDRAHGRLTGDETRDQSDDDARCRRRPSPPRRRDDGHRHRRAHGREESGSDRAVGPGQVLRRDARGDVGDRGDPGGGHPRQGSESVAQPRERRNAGEGSGDGRGRRGGIGEHVGRHAQQRNMGVDEHDQRSAHQLCRQGNGDRQPEGSRHPSRQSRGEGAGEHEEGAGGGGREGESDRQRQPRIDHQQHGHRERQHGHTDGRAPQSQREEGDQGHGRRADDAGLGRDEGHERGEDDGRATDAHAPRCTAQREHREGGADDDRAVRSRDGGQMRQRRGVHGRLGRAVEHARVPHREAGHQTRPRLGQPHGGMHQPAAYVLERAPDAGRWSRGIHRLGANEQNRALRRVTG